MVDYPTDIALNEHKDVFIDDGNDIATVTGEKQLIQSVAINVFDETFASIGAPLSGEEIASIESDIFDALDTDPQISTVQSVRVDSYNVDEGSVTVTVETVANDDFTLPIAI